MATAPAVPKVLLAVEADAALPPNLPNLFVSATQPLSVWLNSAKFRYEIGAIQRDYEWDDTQVHGLLDSIAQLKEKGDKPDAVVKLSEVVLLDRHTRDTQAWRISHNDPSWYNDFHSVAVIDGQQRITTVVIIAAVAQFKLLQVVDQMTQLNPSNTKALQVVKNFIKDKMELNFTYKSGHRFRHCLLSRHDDSNSMGLQMGIFNFSSDRANEDLARVLRDGIEPETNNYHRNAIHTSKWFDKQLEQLQSDGRDASAGTAELEINDLSVARLQAKWLMEFVQVLLQRVYWTTTLTCSTRLALDIFVNVNLGNHRVALSEPDIVKVTLVADLGELQSGRAVHHWDLCIAKLNTMAKDLAREGSKLPHIKFLSTDSKLSSNSAEALTALTLDFLRHMCCIQSSGKPGAICPSLVGIVSRNVLVQHFVDYRMNIVRNRNYIVDDLQPYVLAYCTMLMQKVYLSIHNTSTLPIPKARTSLLVLLSMNDTSWRPAAMAVICEISRDRNMTDKMKRDLLEHALMQLEVVALRLTVAAKKPTSQQIWAAVLKYVIDAGKSSILEAAIGKPGDNKLVGAAFSIDGLPANIRDASALFQYLYTNKMYRPSCPAIQKLTKSVILGIELGERETDPAKVGLMVDCRWEGEITLEHLLPKKLTEDYWTQRFGPHEGHVHNGFMHLLGNLSILTRPDNSSLSNNSLDDKRELMKSRNIDLMTLKYIYTELDEINGWNICAILGRQEWLLTKLAKRYGMIVEKDNWRKWRKELLQGIISDGGSFDEIMEYISDATKELILGIQEHPTAASSTAGSSTTVSGTTVSGPAVSSITPVSSAPAATADGVQLKHLIAEKYLQPGLKVLSLHRCKKEVADLKECGKIVYHLQNGDDREFGELTKFSKFARHINDGGDPSVEPSNRSDGWEDVYYDGKKLVYYKNLHKIYSETFYKSDSSTELNLGLERLHLHDCQVTPRELKNAVEQILGSLADRSKPRYKHIVAKLEQEFGFTLKPRQG